MADTYSERARIWVGMFPSRRAYGNYFFPKSSRLDAPPTPFAVDQGVEFYGFMSTYIEFRDEGPTENLRSLLKVYRKTGPLVERACQAYSQAAIGPVNTIVLAFGNELRNPKPVKGDNYFLHVLGEFTDEVLLSEGEADEEDDFVEPAHQTDPDTAKWIAGDGATNEDRFWGMIERAWAADPDGDKLRQRFLNQKRKSYAVAEALQFQHCPTFVSRLEAALTRLNKRDLIKFDRILERCLHTLDRPDLHDRTGGSNDGFLYCRGFIVSLGKDYFDHVCAEPKRATPDVECEDICLCAVREYVRRYDQPPPPSRISRESFSNKTYWK